jgi:hypothetical protein
VSLKERVHVKKTQTLQHLEDSIREEIQNIRHNTLKKVMESVLLRAQQCVAAGDGPFK